MTVNSPDSLPDDEVQESAAGQGEKSRNDGGIPGKEQGVGLGASDEPNTFEPEEAGEDADGDIAGEDDEEGPQ
ncbi:hypothetical protein V1639_09220 [Pseudarthrobacter sp. J75]|uniref:hypothetical protein n=1 Tax=unclassified Pseudarthrobacter TaxID=2647000 RepID=UPI002E81CE54|nr:MULTISPECIES: hypothetical protein [unclassified Pseudarthrobacter]MEE2522463.1 hypothetical protein [Pseudarthrobacter sp. J47]MEE2529206.1 hypothetical protein [Pseudarthrobacter sp. J75]MEE2570493.1 hypothetical protein [Pseudarthrobacter sp. J64]